MNNEIENEIWKTYPEFDWIQGSNLGRLRTLDRYVKQGNAERFVKGRFLKPQIDRYGYLQVNFRVNGKQVHRKVHRIIASCFIPNPDNLPEVNHRDCNIINNLPNNLEWCTSEYNIAYREKYGTSAAEAVGRPVYAVNLKTLEVLRFETQSEASQKLSVNCGNLNSVLKGRYKQTGGYWFTYADENAVESTRAKFGDDVAAKVETLLKENQN